ncbi:FtsQ-type POTRA domain-containing protein [Clostridiaceae bacterium M8S5]|nr:FtsQ-type POTRA domain-containing protein [Clostridiaceae bacterium M8S5]
MASKAVNRKIKRRKRKFKLFIFFMLIATSIYLMFNTKYFNIEEIVVVGNSQIETDKIVLLSGIEKGINIFKLRKNAVVENIKMHPYIKGVSVDRDLPKKVVINILERKEAFVIKSLDSYIYADDEGKVLSVLSDKKDVDLIKLSNFGITNVIIGQNLKLEEDITMKEILDFMKKCKIVKLHDKLTVINKNENQQIELLLKNGLVVEFGKLRNINHKLSFLVSILEDLKSKNINNGIISFNKGKNPVFMPTNK